MINFIIFKIVLNLMTCRVWNDSERQYRQFNNLVFDEKRCWFESGVTPKTLKYWIHNAKQKLKRSNEPPV